MTSRIKTLQIVRATLASGFALFDITSLNRQGDDQQNVRLTPR